MVVHFDVVTAGPIVALLSPRAGFVIELARRNMQRGASLDSFVVLVLDTASAVAAMAAIPEATKDGVCIYAVPLSRARHFANQIDKEIANSLEDLPATGDVRVLVVGRDGAVGITHVTVMGAG